MVNVRVVLFMHI